MGDLRRHFLMYESSTPTPPPTGIRHLPPATENTRGKRNEHTHRGYSKWSIRLSLHLFFRPQFSKHKILETTFGPNKILTCKNKTFHFQVLSPRVFLFAVGYIYGHHKCPLHALKTMYTDEVNYLNFGYTNH